MGRQRVVAFAFFGLFALAMIGGGVFIITVQQRGESARATVTECHRRVRPASYSCTGTWVTGGDLADGGRVVVGTIDGADSGDVGKTIDVRLSGDRAYTTSLRLPVILIAIGVVIAGLAAWQFRSSAPERKASKSSALGGPPPTGPALAGAPPPLPEPPTPGPRD
jgi:hypothetical protein